MSGIGSQEPSGAQAASWIPKALHCWRILGMLVVLFCQTAGEESDCGIPQPKRLRLPSLLDSLFEPARLRSRPAKTLQSNTTANSTVLKHEHKIFFDNTIRSFRTLGDSDGEEDDEDDDEAETELEHLVFDDHVGRSWMCGLDGGGLPFEAFVKWSDQVSQRWMSVVNRTLLFNSSENFFRYSVRENKTEETTSESAIEKDKNLTFSLERWAQKINETLYSLRSTTPASLTESISQRRDTIRAGLVLAWKRARKKLLSAWVDGLASLQDWDLSQPWRNYTESLPNSRNETAGVDHLYVLVHGLHGSPSNLAFMAKCMREKLGPRALVHIAECNSGGFGSLLTHDGIDAGGRRLADEVSCVVQRSRAEGQQLKYISLLGNSLGGLYSRFALGLLYDNATSLVAGLKAVSFVTTASPHLGVRGLIPKTLEATVTSVALFGATGQQLFLADETSSGGWLLHEMTSDCMLPFLSALEAFQHRVLYGNTCNDFLVKFETASISPVACVCLRDFAPISEEYPHIIFDSLQQVQEWPPQDWFCNSSETFFEGDERESQLQEMLESLQRLGWRRVGARFQRTVDGKTPLPFPLHITNAHNQLPVVRPNLDSAGSDSVRHLCEVWSSHSESLHRSQVAEVRTK